MTAPRTVKVGPFSYSIERGWNGDDFGDTDFNSTVIRIRGGLSADAERETVLHECLHCATDLVGERVRLGDEREEELVRALSPALLAILRDNPALVRYLLG